MNIDRDALKSQMEATMNNLRYYEELGAPVVDEYSKDLDEKITAIQEYMAKCREFDVDFDVASLQRIVMELSSTIYYTQDKLERLGLLEDLSNITYKERYNSAYLNKQANYDAGTKYTVEQLRNFAEQEALPERLTNFIYSHAASVIKGKIESAYEVLKAASKALSAQIQSMSTFNIGNKYSG